MLLLIKRILFLIFLLITTTNIYGQRYNDVILRNDYLGLGAKEFLLPTDTIFSASVMASVQRCRAIAKKNGIVYHFDCSLEKWVPIGSGNIDSIYRKIGTDSVFVRKQPNNLNLFAFIDSSFNSSVGSTITSSTTLTAIKEITYLVDATGGSITLTLPSASTISGLRMFIKRIDNSENTVTISGIDIIDINTIAPYGALQIQAYGSGNTWYVISKY